MSDIRIGTSAFTAKGWQGSFYPKGLRPAEYLSYYAQHFDTVEIDSTFYATPNVSVVRSWDAKTPNRFLFAAKVPQEITHEKVLKDCVDREGDLSEWVSLLKKIQERRIMILAFANNHYAGHGPSTVDLFRSLWGIEAPRVVHGPRQRAEQSSLFD